jgi:hypothetical protein
MKQVQKQENGKTTFSTEPKPFLSQPQDVEQDTFVFCPNTQLAKQCKK